MAKKKTKYPNLEKLLDLELPVIGVLAEKEVTLEETLGLAKGGIIDFKKNCNAPIDLLINDQKIGSGKAIKVGENFGLHVREIGTSKETLEKALGK